MRQRFGRWDAVEDEADAWIRQSLEGVTKYSQKSDVLTKWKEEMRKRREVLCVNGFPEAHIRKGMYNRAANLNKKELNSREGISRARSSGYSSQQTYLTYSGSAPKGDEQDQN